MRPTITAARYRGERRFSLDTVDAAPPAAGEVAVRVAWCGICGTDLHVYRGHMDPRVGFERVIGHEMSGVVDAVGDGAGDWAPGDRVVVRPLSACGSCPACQRGHAHICHHLTFLGLDTDGALQELWNVPAASLHRLPRELPLDHAALIEPLAVACHDVRMAQLQPGEDAVVIGGGPIGVLVAMVAREASAKVLISEVNPARRAIADKLGFATLDPAQSDLLAAIESRTAGKGADVVFEVSGSQSGVDAMTAVAATRARLVMVAIHAHKTQVDLFRFFWRELQLVGVRVYEPDDYEAAIALLGRGAIDADTVITERRPLAEVQAAFDTLDTNPTALKSLIQVGATEASPA